MLDSNRQHNRTDETPASTTAVTRGTPQNVTPHSLTPMHRKVIEVLVNREPKESMADLAAKVGCDRRTIYRYLKDEAFQKAYNERIELTLDAQKGLINRSLIHAAITRGPSQVQALQLYYKLKGQIKERIELSGSIITNDSLVVDRLPLFVKQLLVIAGSGRSISKELEERISQEVGPLYLEVEAEIFAGPDAPKLIGSGSSYYEEGEEEGYMEEEGCVQSRRK